MKLKKLLSIFSSRFVNFFLLFNKKDFSRIKFIAFVSELIKFCLRFYKYSKLFRFENVISKRLHLYDLLSSRTFGVIFLFEWTNLNLKKIRAVCS